MTDAELRAKHVERFDCSLCRTEALTPHNPVWDLPTGSCGVCYEEMPCAILALLTRCEKAEAALKSCTTICDKCGGYVPAAEVCDCQFSVKRIETVLVACGHEPPARIRDLARLACTALLEGER